MGKHEQKSDQTFQVLFVYCLCLNLLSQQYQSIVNVTHKLASNFNSIDLFTFPTGICLQAESICDMSTRDFDHTALFYKILFSICANLLYFYLFIKKTYSNTDTNFLFLNLKFVEQSNRSNDLKNVMFTKQNP